MKNQPQKKRQKKSDQPASSPASPRELPPAATLHAEPTSAAVPGEGKPGPAAPTASDAPGPAQSSPANPPPPHYPAGSAYARFKTDYRTALVGAFRDGAFNELIIDGVPIRLNLKQFIVLVMLMGRALVVARRETPFNVLGELFIPAKFLVEEIKRLIKSKVPAVERWETKHVHDAVWEIRELIKAAKLNPELIEVDRGHGYRLSTAPENMFWNLDMEL